MLTKSELARWTAALRSGEYVQGTEYLKYYDGGVCKHCCLGVLCEIEGLPQRKHGNFYEFEGHTKFLPKILVYKLGSTAGTADVLGMPELDGYRSLTCANDNGTSFSEIADYLDKYYPAIED